jgi:broad-specificity NMP kinase
MWSKNGNRYSHYEKSDEQEFLEPGIYTLRYGPFRSMYLTRDQDKFEFSYKLYGSDGFPERVVKKFQNIQTNLGVLLCGLKGTGKTVQAEQICNFSNLPVIVVTHDFEKGADLIEFLSTVNQEVVVMIDEYEKIFGKSDALLAIMDGILNGTSRRLFVLTANTPHISEAMLDRPSRIHYLKRFGNLEIPVISEVVDDMLKAVEFRAEVIDYLSALDITTIDIVKTVLREVNMFNEPPQKFKDILNVTIHDRARWTVTDEDGEVVIEYGVCQTINPFMKGYDLCFKEYGVYGDEYKDLGYISACNQKTGKITTENGVYTVKKAKSFTSFMARGGNASLTAGVGGDD